MPPAPQFLVAVSFEHAELLDGLVFARLADVDNNKGSRWSGVYTNGTLFGIVWAPEVAALFDPSEVTIATAIPDPDGGWDWYEVPPPEPLLP
jgi:hypothetical protein